MACWASVNAACNLDCVGCYARARPKHSSVDMRPETIKKIVEISSAMGISRIVLLGGEPTLYSGLANAIELSHSHGMFVTIATNGSLFVSSDNLCSTIKSTVKEGDAINFSIKGSYGSLHDETIRRSILRRMVSFEKSGIACSASFVVSHENVGSLGDRIAELRDFSSSPISVSFLGPSVSPSGRFDGLLSRNESCLLSETALEQIKASSAERVSLHVSFPLCWLEENYMDRAAKVCTVITGCQALNRTGILFDPSGNLLLYNHMMEPVGRLGEDFDDEASLMKHVESDGFMRLFEEFTRLPYDQCARCELVAACGGGCPLWFYA